MYDRIVTPATDSSLNSPVISAATVVITTKNRLEDLRKAIASAVAQTAKPEILVMDDGSTDGSAEIIAHDIPGIQVHRSGESHGYIVQRNRGARLAAGRIIFSIDDDAVFSSPTVVEQTLHEFDHPRVGAVAMPFVDVHRSPVVHHRAPGSEGIYGFYSYIGTAHALRRDLFLKLSCYREVLFHQSEEEDYCIRLLDAGYITRCGRADPVHHFESPKRSAARMDFYGARNKVLYAWHNVPFPYLPVHLSMTTLFTSTYARHPARFLTRLRGVLNAYKVIGLSRTRRQPVSGTVYKLSRELKRRGPVPLGEIEHRLPVRAAGVA